MGRMSAASCHNGHGVSSSVGPGRGDPCGSGPGGLRLARPPVVDGFPINAFLTWLLSARPFCLLKSV